MSIRIRIKFDARLLGSSRGGPLRNVNHASRAAYSKRGDRRRDLHRAGLGDEPCDKSGRPNPDRNRRRVALTVLLIDELVDHNARVGGQAKGRLIVECDAQRGIGASRENVVLENWVLDVEGDRRRFAPRDRCLALQSADLAYLIGLTGLFDLANTTLRYARRVLRAGRETSRHGQRQRAHRRHATNKLVELPPLHVHVWAYSAEHPGPTPPCRRKQSAALRQFVGRGCIVKVRRFTAKTPFANDKPRTVIAEPRNGFPCLATLNWKAPR